MYECVRTMFISADRLVFSCLVDYLLLILNVCMYVCVHGYVGSSREARSGHASNPASGGKPCLCNVLVLLYMHVLMAYPLLADCLFPAYIHACMHACPCCLYPGVRSPSRRPPLSLVPLPLPLTLPRTRTRHALPPTPLSRWVTHSPTH